MFNELENPFDRSEDDEDVKDERIPPDELDSPSEAERNGQF